MKEGTGLSFTRKNILINWKMEITQFIGCPPHVLDRVFLLAINNLDKLASNNTSSSMKYQSIQKLVKELTNISI